MISTLTPEQIQARLGKICASQAYRLIPCGRRDMTEAELKEEKEKGGKRKTVDILFGDMAYTYITELAAEELTRERKSFKATFEMQRAIELEEEARQYLKAAKNITIIQPGTKSDKKTAYTIDGWVDEFDTGIEILCPNSDNHLNYMLGDIKTLKSDYPIKYWQITFYAWKYNRESWKFISYDPRFKNQSLKMLMLDFKVDKEDLEYLKMKVDKAYEEKVKIVNRAINLTLVP